MGRQIVVPIPIDVLFRFWSFITKDPESECWNWRKQGKKPYGNFTIDAINYNAHRYAYYLYNGEFDPQLIVRHTCDNSHCVNPDHLILGTQLDNRKDSVDRERNQTGQKHHASKLKDMDVIQIQRILEESDMSLIDIARQFKVSYVTIARIRDGKRR